MTAPVLVIEHQATCPPAWLGTWLAEAGLALKVSRPWAGDEVPPLDGTAADDSRFAGLLVLGGEMSADDDLTVPWLPAVKERLREAAGSGLPALGVCLGHQLAAVALGGEVRPNPHGQTVGLTPLGWTDEAAADPLVGSWAAADTVGVHWNGDVVTRLPSGATVLARTADGYPQVVRFADRLWGVQLHPEADRHVVTAWAAGDRAEHLERGLDQEAVLAAITAAEPVLAQTWRRLADSFAGVVRAGAPGA